MDSLSAALAAATSVDLAASTLFAIAIIHIFATAVFQSQFAALAHSGKAHAGWWHVLGEAEAVFKVWSVIFIAAMVGIVALRHGALDAGVHHAVAYLDSLHFTEPMFVFVIMVLASTRPMEVLADQVMRAVAAFVARFRIHYSVAYFWALMAIGPLLGSVITEPAAMTLVATLLVRRFFMKAGDQVREGLTTAFKYAAVGTLFLNISIGGTLTTFAAPPVVMVAAPWGIDNAEVFALLGWKAAVAVGINTSVLAFIFRRQLAAVQMTADRRGGVSIAATVVHLLALAGVVYFAHHPVVFIGIFLFMLAYMGHVSPQHQHDHHEPADEHGRKKSAQNMRSALMVGIFLAGLVVLGAPQKWWLQPLLTIIPSDVLYYLATGLTAITDNAMLTYLASLVQGTDEAFRYAMLAGSVTGGGLTIIANAPNMPGYAIVRVAFTNEKGEIAFNHLYLFLGALPATIVAVLAFQLLPHL